MSTTDTANNGKTNALHNTTKKGQKRPNVKALRSVGDTSNYTETTISYRIADSLTDWDRIPAPRVFSLDKAGNFLYLKDSSSSYICLKTFKRETGIGSGAGFLAFL